MDSRDDNTPERGSPGSMPPEQELEAGGYDWDRHRFLKQRIDRLSIVYAVIAGRRNPRDINPAEMVMPELVSYMSTEGKPPPLVVFTEMIAAQSERIIIAADDVAGKVALRSNVTISLLDAFMKALPGEQWSFGVGSEFYHIENDLEGLGHEITATALLYDNDFMKNVSLKQWAECRHSVCSDRDQFSVLRERFNDRAGMETPSDLTAQVLSKRCADLAGHIDELTHIILDHVQAKHDMVQDCIQFAGSLDMLGAHGNRAPGNTRAVMMDVASGFMELAYFDLDIAEMTRNRSYHMRETGRPVFRMK